jgi:hypothetical protein
LFPATLVGRYPQRERLIGRGQLGKRFAPRLRRVQLITSAPPA